MLAVKPRSAVVPSLILRVSQNFIFGIHLHTPTSKPRYWDAWAVAPTRSPNIFLKKKNPYSFQKTQLYLHMKILKAGQCKSDRVEVGEFPPPHPLGMFKVGSSWAEAYLGSNDFRNFGLYLVQV